MKLLICLLVLLPTVSYPQGFDVGVDNGIYCSFSTTWDGSYWSNGLPAADKDAIIAADYIQYGGTFSACSIFVTGNAQVRFQNNSNAIITHNLNVGTNASLIFESGSNLLQIENTQNVGNVIIQRYGSRLKKLDYSFWSSPVTGNQTLLEFSPATLQNRFYTYSTATNDFLSDQSPLTATFITARAYLIRMPNQITGPQAAAYNAGQYRFAYEGLFAGVPNNGDINIPLVYTGDTNSYNGVGNPYPSPISITDFINANIDNIEGTIWMWRKSSNPNETSYSTMTRLGYVANHLPGSESNDVNDLIADPFAIDEEGIINTGQGFMVKAKNNQDLVFNNNMRKLNNCANFFRNSETQNITNESNALAASRIWINVVNGDGAFSQTMVGYTPEATLEYDNGIDGEGLVDATACLYSVIEGAKLAIQGRPAFSKNDIVPLGFKTQIEGQFTMKLDHVNGEFSGDQDIYIRDNFTGLDHDIKENDLTFTSEVGTFENRFEIFYAKPETLVAGKVTTANDIIIFNNDNRIHVNTPEAIKSIIVYDFQGRVVYKNNTINKTEYVSPPIGISQQAVIVKIAFSGAKAVTKKMIVGN